MIKYCPRCEDKINYNKPCFMYCSCHNFLSYDYYKELLEEGKKDYPDYDKILNERKKSWDEFMSTISVLEIVES